MTKTSKQIRTSVDAVSKAVEAALAAIAKEHGLESLKMGRGSFDHEGAFTLKVEGVIGGGKSKEASHYEMMAEAMNLPPLHTTFKNTAGTDKIIGLNTTGTKVITERDNGKRFLWQVDAVIRICRSGSLKEAAPQSVAALTA